MKKRICFSITALLMVLVFCSVCLVGCSQKNKFDKKIDKVLKKTQEYVSADATDDFYDLYDYLKNSDEETPKSVRYYEDQLYSGNQPLNADEYSHEYLEKLLQFFKTHPDIGSIYFYGEDGLWLWHQSLESYIILRENGEPAPLYGPDDYVRKEVEGTIYWTSDHRKDKESYHRNMYYEFGFQNISETLWVGYFFVKYPWYSRFFV